MFKLVPWSKKQERNPNTALQTTRRDLEPIDTVFDRFFGGLTDDWFDWPLNLVRNEQRWGLDVQHRADEVFVRAEAPGFNPDELNVQLSGNCLTISAEHHGEDKSGNGSHYEQRSFRRMVSVPPGIEADRIEARYHNGVLEVHLPKREDAKGKRIPIKT